MLVKSAVNGLACSEEKKNCLQLERKPFVPVCALSGVYVVAQFYPRFKFYTLLVLDMFSNGWQ